VVKIVSILGVSLYPPLAPTGYRDTLQITTLSTTPYEEHVEDGPDAFCRSLGACLLYSL
jgi:hypothetical protein